MIKIFDAKQVHPYSLDSDTDEVKTVFFIGSLHPAFHAHLTDTLVGEAKEPKPGSLIRAIVRHGVKGWENFPDHKGNLIVFDEAKHTTNHTTKFGPQKGLTDEALDLIDWNAQQELFNAIGDANKLTKADEKNSPTPSQPS